MAQELEHCSKTVVISHFHTFFLSTMATPRCASVLCLLLWSSSFLHAAGSEAKGGFVTEDAIIEDDGKELSTRPLPANWRELCDEGELCQGVCRQLRAMEARGAQLPGPPARSRSQEPAEEEPSNEEEEPAEEESGSGEMDKVKSSLQKMQEALNSMKQLLDTALA